MSVQLPDGSKLYIETEKDKQITISEITNTNPAIATAENHNLLQGDYIELLCGWSNATGRIVRVGKVINENSFELEGINAENTRNYPIGGGTGSARKISARVQITQILDFSSSGGEQQFATYQFLEDDFVRQIPTNTSAQSITLGIGDDQTLEGYKALKLASENRANCAVFLELRGGSTIAYNAIVSLNETPKITKGSVMQVDASLSLQARPMRY